MSDEQSAKSDGEMAAMMLRLVQGVDITSADGRAGLTSLLREIEAAAPGAIERLSAMAQLRRARRALPGTPTTVQ